jgi:hypothetical protein
MWRRSNHPPEYTQRTTPLPTIKEQAAAARAAGLTRFIADRPCKRGHVERRTDAQATCVTCDYLRNSAQYPGRQTPSCCR